MSGGGGRDRFSSTNRDDGTNQDPQVRILQIHLGLFNLTNFSLLRIQFTST